MKKGKNRTKKLGISFSANATSERTKKSLNERNQRIARAHICLPECTQD